MKKKLVIFIIIALIIISTLFSIFKFDVYNPISAFGGMMQILFTDTEYTVVQNYPNKVIFAKPRMDLFEEYMENNGYECLQEERMGTIHVYRNDMHKVKIHFSMNQYYSKWTWESTNEIDKFENNIGYVK